MLALLAEVIQNIFAITTSILKGIGQDWKVVEGPFSVDARGEGNDSGCSPGWTENDTALEGDIKNAIKYFDLGYSPDRFTRQLKNLECAPMSLCPQFKAMCCCGSS